MYIISRNNEKLMFGIIIASLIIFCWENYFPLFIPRILLGMLLLNQNPVPIPLFLYPTYDFLSEKSLYISASPTKGKKPKN